MTTNDLRNFFNQHRVPGKLYDLKGSRNQRLCMEHDKDGWNVYFADRNDKVGLMHFNNETDACLSMKEEVRKVMAGIYGLTWA